MNKHKQPAGLRNLAHVAAGLVLWAVTTIVARRALHAHPTSLALRIVIVAVGVGGFLPWLISVGRLIMAQDEFSVRVHLVAIALTCAATAVLVLVGDYLQMAGLVGNVPLQQIWMAMGVVWWLAIMMASWYYR